MGHLLSSLRDGDFLTRERIRVWAGVFLAGFAAAILYLAVTAHGLNDYKGRPLGSDFSNVYAAGTLVRDGFPADAFDAARLHARERLLFGEATPFYGWHYPPFLLLAAWALAQLPYLPALILWQGVTLALYLAALVLLLHNRPKVARDPLWVLCALAFPAVFVNLVHGQNGFLTAALFASALALLDRRPVVAGLLFGLIAYKPQFGIMIPLVLVAGWRRHCFAAATISVVALVLAATFAFGLDIWSAFFASTQFSREVVLEQGGTGFEKIQSVFAAVRMWNGSPSLAYTAQIVATFCVAVPLIALWHSRASLACKGAGLCLGALLATPYLLDYDMMVLAPAIALMAADGREGGFLPYERVVLAALWLVPIAARFVAGATGFPLGLIVMALGFALVIRRGLKTSVPAAA